jgi:chromosome segregation ATPase
MKKLLFAATLNFAFAAMVFTACDSKQEKVEDAQEEVNEAKEDLKDAKQELNAEYPSYRQAQEDRINMNQKRIDDLRAKINTGGKPLDEARQKRIQELEEKNAELRSRLAGYETERSDWEEFKREFDHDMEELGKSFDDMGNDNVK